MKIKNARRAGRIKLDRPITIFVYGRELSCKLNNISLLGAGITGTSFLNMEIGQQVSINLPDVGKLRGQVRWTGLSGGGIGFDIQSQNNSRLKNYISQLEKNPGAP